MPKPTPEVQQAQANFKAAQQALQAATFAQWEAGGVPLLWRIWAAFMGAGVGLMVSMPILLLWSDYLLQQQWAARTQQNPQLGYPYTPSSLHVGFGPYLFLLLPIIWTFQLYKTGKLLYSYPNARRTLAFAAGFGVLLGLLGAYVLSRPLFAPI